MDRKLNWGIIGTGGIATAFARGLGAARTGRLFAVGSRAQETADRFGSQWGAQRCYPSYAELVADREVDAVYIAAPHPFHAEWAIRAARAGKHVLVEKPIGINHAQAMAIVEAAIENDVFLMEAFMYRCHPQTARLVELIRDRAIGQVRVIQSCFSFHSSFDEEGRLFANEFAGGGILDVGCYPTSVSMLIAGVAGGADYAVPVEVKGCGHLGQTGVDEWAVASLRFPGDILAQAATGIGVWQDNTLRVFGSEGHILVGNPWTHARTAADPVRITVHRKGQKQPEEIDVPTAGTAYTYEADVVGDAVRAGKRRPPHPAMSPEESLANMRVLDAWRESIGLVYEAEKPAGFSRTTIAGEPLRVRAQHNMRHGRIAGLDKPVSRLIMGCDNQRTLPHAAAMFDDFFERGGNAFDTAFVYGGGSMEQLLGQWIRQRGVRDQVVIIVKGAHTPFCNPADLVSQLTTSLERLATDHADIYLMHRDNPQVPAGEFVEVLNEQVRAGRIKAFGGSNWTLGRVEEANAYAAAKGLKPMSLVSNNFSLARMVQPVWGGCISAGDPESRRWLARTQMPLFAWSSQARGFFLEGKAHPANLQDKDLARCWYSDDNFRRLERVNELAGRRAVKPINIALAYVLCQPFPTYALIGPRTLEETRTSLPGLDIELSPSELRWLNLED